MHKHCFGKTISVKQKSANMKNSMDLFSGMNFLVFQVEGTPERPRLAVFRSNKHLAVQVIDDTKMHTLASASTMQKAIAEEFSYTAGPTIVSSL